MARSAAVARLGRRLRGWRRQSPAMTPGDYNVIRRCQIGDERVQALAGIVATVAVARVRPLSGLSRVAVSG